MSLEREQIIEMVSVSVLIMNALCYLSQYLSQYASGNTHQHRILSVPLG